MTKKKYRKKWPSDEWFEQAKRQSGRGFGAHNKKRIILVTDGNLKKWVELKYYGCEELSDYY